MWVECPPGQAGTDCATLHAPLDRDGNHSGTVDIFMRRVYHSTGPTGRAVFLIDGGPGFSTNALIGMARFLLSVDRTVTVYLIDQRGTGLSSPLYCRDPPQETFAPEDPSIVQAYRECLDDVIDAREDDLAFFSTYHGARDFLDAVNTINPDTVAIYALSYGTYFTNMYLQLPGARADAVVLDGPVPCDRWALENNAEWVSRVSMDILRFCGQLSPLCANKTGLMGQIPRLVMDSVVDRTLPCLERLPWLSQRVAATYSSFMTLNQTAHVLMAPFWFRLYRCTDSDVSQLNTFHVRMTGRRRGRREVSVANDANDTSATPFVEYAIGLAVNIGASEVYSYGSRSLALNYSEQVLLTSRVFADASPELQVSFARQFWPLYTPHSETYMRFARPTVPVIVMVGTLDPNTPHGNGIWLANGLGDNATLITVPFAAHGTFSPGADCPNSIISRFLLSLGKKPDTTCLSQIPPPDFGGAQNSTIRLSNEFFGTENLWPVPATPITTTVPTTTTTTTTAATSNGTCRHSITDAQVAGVGVGCAIGSAFITCGVFWLCGRKKQTKRNPYAYTSGTDLAGTTEG